MSGTFSAPRNGGISNTKSIKVISDRPSPINDHNKTKSIKTNPSFLIDDQITQGMSRDEAVKNSHRKDSLNFNESEVFPASGLVVNNRK
jgi:hypothetical protein